MKYRYTKIVTLEFDTEDFPDFFEFDGTYNCVKAICDEFGTDLWSEMPAKYHSEEKVEKI